MPRHTPNGAAPPTPKYRSVRIAAEIYDVDEKTVRRWVTRGLIHGYRVGGKLLKVDLAEIDANVVKIVPTAARSFR